MTAAFTPTDQERHRMSREQNKATRNGCRRLDPCEAPQRKTFFATMADARPPARAPLDLRG